MAIPIYGTYGKIYHKSDTKSIKQMNIKSAVGDGLCQPNIQECVFYQTYAKYCPYICKVYNIKTNHDSFFITLERCKRTLYKYIMNTKLDEREKNFKWILFQLAEVYYFLSICGLIHGDTKSWNILMSNKTHDIKLCDFGSIISFRLTNNMSALCTYDYASLESLICSDSEQYWFDSKTDMWSLGIVCIEYFNGSTTSLYKETSTKVTESTLEILEKIYNTDIDKKKYISELENVINTYLSNTFNSVIKKSNIKSFEIDDNTKSILNTCDIHLTLNKIIEIS
jgi:serine/threonine protein kinase